MDGAGGPLFGRDSEMATLRLAAANAAVGNVAGVVLVGEAGVGKTRLAMQLAGELAPDGAVVVTSHGVQLAGGELPYAGAGELVRGLVRALGAAELTRAAGRDLRALGAFDGSLGEAQPPERTAVITALLAALEGVGRQRTIVWIVDDLHWLDAASQDLMRYLVRVAHDARLLLLVTVRDGAPGADPALELVRAPGVTTLSVGPLDDAAVDDQARSLASRPLDPSELERIRRLSDGLPFFVEELVAAGGDTPPTLRRALAMTTRDLTDDTRLLLRAAALEERLSTPELLARVAGLTEQRVASALAEARERDIVRLDRESLRFRHALLREAVDAEMLVSERRTLHRRWAEALADKADAPGAPVNVVLARAGHWHEAGDPGIAFPYVLAAAQYVDTLESAAAQALWWGRAFEDWPESLDAVGSVTRDRALSNHLAAALSAGAAPDALRTLRNELAAPASPDRLRDLWLVLMHREIARTVSTREAVAAAPGNHDDLFEWLLARGPDFRVNSILHLLLHEWDADRPDLYVPICEELMRRGVAENDTENWFLAKRHLGWWHQNQGDFAGQLATARAAREVVQAAMPARRLQAEWDLCWGLEESGRYVEALSATERALAGVEEPRAVSYTWQELASCAVTAHRALGEWDAAHEWVHRMESVGGHLGGAPPATLVGEIAVRLGQLEQAEATLSMLEVEEDESHHLRGLLRTSLTAEIALVTEDPPRAEAALASLERLPHAMDSPDDVAQTVISLGRLCEQSTAAMFSRVLTQAERLVPTPGGPVQVAVRAELAEHGRRVGGTDTVDGWVAVVEAWRALGRVYDVAWCGYVLGACAARNGDRDQALSALGEARRIAGELGAGPLSDRIAALARRHRLRLPGLAADSVGDLTDRETQVLRLIALGRSNNQIAAELFMSPKTASVHVSRILAKLGAGNRTEAAALARRLGVE